MATNCKDQYTKDLGNKAEIATIAELVKRGYSVAIPFGQNDPYDLIVKCGGVFKSVQVKHAAYKNGCVIADIRHRTGYNKKTYSSYQNEADLIAIWCEDLDEVFLFSLNECGDKTQITLRIEPPKNNSCISTVVWAKDHTIDNKTNLLE